MLIELLRSKEWYGKSAQAELAYAQLTGMNCLGYETLEVTDAAAVGLPNLPATEPAVAVKALLVVEADSTSADTSMVIRWREDENDPTAAEGMPLGHLSIYEVGGIQNLTNWKAIGIEAGKTHKVRISYYG